MSYRKRIGSLLLGLVLCFGALAPYHLPANAADAEHIDPSIALGNGFAIAIASDGTAWSWGRNNVGQLGINTHSNANVTTPEKVVTNVRFREVAAGDSHVIGLGMDGAVYAWGENGMGQLGLGEQTTENQAVPVQISALEGLSIQAVAAGGNTSFALTVEGDVYAWGANTNYMLGDPMQSVGATVATPTPIEGLAQTSISQIVAGEGTVAAIATNGRLWIWGENENEQCGLLAGADVKQPTEKSPSDTEMNAEPIRAVAPGRNHTAFLSSSYTILNMGSNAVGQFGNGRTDEDHTYPFWLSKNVALIGEGLSVAEIAAGSEHTVARTANGKILVWGSNSAGQLAQATGTSINHTPTEVSLDSYTNGTAVAIAAAYNNTAVIDSEGHVFTWGSDSHGQLGNGSASHDATAPVKVLGEDGVGFLYLGVPTEDTVHAVYVTANATVPSPAFCVSIPATMDFGVLEQKSSTAENRICEIEFSVGAQNVRYLFGKQLVVRVKPSVGDSFALLGNNGSQLPYDVYSASAGDTKLTPESEFAVFEADGSVSGRVTIDQSNIVIADTYRGELIFYVSVTDGAAS